MSGTISVVTGQESFGDIHRRLSKEIIDAIRLYGFDYQDGVPKPKIAMSLMRAISSEVERELWLATKMYITARFEEQVNCYIERSFPSFAGYSNSQFRESLKPLLERLLKFFSPPSNHLIEDGEFTLLLVIPPAWIPLRRQLMSFTDVPISDDVETQTEVRINGKTAPQSPYVIIGIDGGRGLKDLSIQESDRWVTEEKRTYLSAHELIQLYLLRPHFLSAKTDAIHSQPEALVLGDVFSKGLLVLVAEGNKMNFRFERKDNSYGGRYIGKPHYVTRISLVD